MSSSKERVQILELKLVIENLDRISKKLPDILQTHIKHLEKNATELKKIDTTIEASNYWLELKEQQVAALNSLVNISKQIDKAFDICMAQNSKVIKANQAKKKGLKAPFRISLKGKKKGVTK